jgi:hypothetical protein
VFDVHHKPYGLYKVWSKTEIGAASGAPDIVRCPGRGTSRTSRSRVFSARVRYNSLDYPVCHRTVRWANGAMVNFSNGRLHWRVNSAQSRSRKSELQSQNASDCPMSQKDKGLQRSTALNLNSRLTWHASDSEQCHVRCTTGLSGVTIDNKLSQRLGSGWRL